MIEVSGVLVRDRVLVFRLDAVTGWIWKMARPAPPPPPATAANDTYTLIVWLSGCSKPLAFTEPDARVVEKLLLEHHAPQSWADASRTNAMPIPRHAPEVK